MLAWQAFYQGSFCPGLFCTISKQFITKQLAPPWLCLLDCWKARSVWWCWGWDPWSHRSCCEWWQEAKTVSEVTGRKCRRRRALISVTHFGISCTLVCTQPSKMTLALNTKLCVVQRKRKSSEPSSQTGTESFCLPPPPHPPCSYCMKGWTSWPLLDFSRMWRFFGIFIQDEHDSLEMFRQPHY